MSIYFLSERSARAPTCVHMHVFVIGVQLQEWKGMNHL